MNLTSQCTYYTVRLYQLPKDLDEHIRNKFAVDADCIEFELSEDDISDLDIPSETINYDSYRFDEDEFESIMEDYLGRHSKYLVFGEHIHWNGDSGYMIADSISDACTRKYDFTLNLIEELGSDAILCLESSHDAPTGAQVIFIGLSDEDAGYLEDCEFDEVEAFINKYKR